MKAKQLLTLFILLLTACNASASLPTGKVDSATATSASTETMPPPTETSSPVPTETSVPTSTPTLTPIPVVENLKAKVIADKLVCRYGPGANYLYLIALNRNTPLTLIGRAEGNNWVLIENRGRSDSHDCWVNGEFVQAEGDMKHLKVVYPDVYKIPVSPYYGPTTVLSATREGDEITVSWIEIIVSPGKYENENMFPYIVEVWRCENGEYLFETLGTTYPAIKFIDQQGCDQPSHGRVYIQEKHGYAGPADIPWPGY
jgi:hypothetical protein